MSDNKPTEPLSAPPRSRQLSTPGGDGFDPDLWPGRRVGILAVALPALGLLASLMSTELGWLYGIESAILFWGPAALGFMTLPTAILVRVFRAGKRQHWGAAWFIWIVALLVSSWLLYLMFWVYGAASG